MNIAVALARYLSCPPELREPLGGEWDGLAPSTWQALISYFEARELALEAYQAFVVEKRLELPEAEALRLRRHYVRSVASVRWLTSELGRVSRAFAAVGIEPVLLKGAYLGALLWPDPALRPFADLDLWVRPQEVQAADAALRTIGYGGGPVDPSVVLDPLYHELPAYQLAGSGPGIRASVDLHYHLAPAYLPVPDEEAMRRRCVPWRDCLQVLAAEDLPVYLCGHIARHLFVEHRPELLFQAGYRYLGELARLVVYGLRRWRWERVAAGLARNRHRRALLLPLRLVNRLWNVVLPEPIVDLYRKDLLGEAVLRALLARMDRPWQELESRMLTFCSYALPDYLSRRRWLVRLRKRPGAR
ncbi:nucleotidyltransferase family protein [Gloeobacter kilaueensis]|uniref:Nucleotidyltransferase family protein n=1 Tax=Gloeobacter kilaueensis (strain ATCC BAA-2537 / CCAP 1431/1 / ULC 316 / JS1) TaxID=1183438 RepID=U5QJ89_GLOK1|nr:nucleotidyltransferase family protein [Gloeobacter kilaueensis]AGY57689.1 hypothetical protein GKIL_1443 [Gloeobacter kilaueensis JS1]